MEAAGFAPEDYETDPVDVWPENWLAVMLLCDMSTQWRTGMAGATGLDYPVLFRLMDEAGLKGTEWRDTFEAVRCMESVALDQMRK